MGSGIKSNIDYIIIQVYYGLKNFFAYRTQALVWIVFSVLMTLATYITINVIYTVSSGISGWNYYQLLLLGATGSMVFALIYSIFNMNNASHALLHGQIDIYLIRPFKKLSIFITMDSFPAAGFTFFSSLALFIYCLANLHVTLLGILGYVILFAASVVMLIVFFAFLVVLIYVYVKGSDLFQRFTNFAGQAGEYPINVYGTIGSLIFSTVFPIGFAYYYPPYFLTNGLGVYGFAEVLIGCFVITAISYVLFNHLMKSYTSGRG